MKNYPEKSVLFHIQKKNYNAFKLLSNKQSVEEVLTQRAVKTIIQILDDKGFFDGCPNAD